MVSLVRTEAHRLEVAILLGLLLISILAGCAHFGAGHKETRPRSEQPSEETNRPIIGVLSMELSPTVQRLYGHHDSYIAASYVKFIEGAGARVAPILIGQPPAYYEAMAKSVNGLLLPGGATFFDGENGYGEAGRKLYAQALLINEGGVYFPVLGICLGMEFMMVTAAGRDLRAECDSHQALPLSFLPGWEESRLFAAAPEAVLDTLQKSNVTVNEHKYCVTRDDMERSGLGRDWRTLSVNEDSEGREFVSVVEHHHLPFYGVQFHPEKTIYEWKRSKGYPHSKFGVEAARYFADFFVSEARKNSHSFASEKEERERLIYKHQPTYTGDHLSWEQLYFLAHPQTDTTPSSRPISSTAQDIDSQFE